MLFGINFEEAVKQRSIREEIRYGYRGTILCDECINFGRERILCLISAIVASVRPFLAATLVAGSCRFTFDHASEPGQDLSRRAEAITAESSEYSMRAGVGRSFTSSQFPLPFGNVIPPRLFRFPGHVPNDGNECVQHAWVVSLAGDVAQFLVHRIRITTEQAGRRRDAQPTQVTGDGGTDIRDVFQTSDIVPRLGSHVGCGVFSCIPFHGRLRFSRYSPTKRCVAP